MEKKQQKNNKSINLTPEQIKTIQISSLVFLCIFIIFLIFKGSPFNIAVLSDSQIENSPNVIKITNTDSENADAVQKEEAETQENSDTLETTELESSKEILKDTVEQINNLKNVDMVMFAGNLVNSATEENYKDFYKIANNLKHPYYITFGNKDFYGMESQNIPSLTRKLNPNYFTSKTYYSYCPKRKYCVISLDSTIKSTELKQGEINTNQLMFLEEELKNYENKVVIILIHHPVIAPYENNNLKLRNAKELEDILLKRKKPVIILSGLYHTGKITKKENLLNVSTPSIASYPMGFYYVKLKDYKNKTKVNVKYIPTRLEDINKQSKLKLKNSSLYEIKEKDKEASFILKKGK